MGPLPKHDARRRHDIQSNVRGHSLCASVCLAYVDLDEVLELGVEPGVSTPQRQYKSVDIRADMFDVLHRLPNVTL